MYNYTDCVVVVKNYYFEKNPDCYELVSTNEYLFKNKTKTTRYCFLVTGNTSKLYSITEHKADLFYRVVQASCGWALFNVYLAEKIDPVPINKLFGEKSNTVKYKNLTEFYVIYNCEHNEATFITKKKRKLKDIYSAVS